MESDFDSVFIHSVVGFAFYRTFNEPYDFVDKFADDLVLLNHSTDDPNWSFVPVEDYEAHNDVEFINHNIVKIGNVKRDRYADIDIIDYWKYVDEEMNDKRNYSDSELYELLKYANTHASFGKYQVCYFI